MSISSINRAISGLYVSQKGLQVTGHNISNVNTQGYTRQQLLIKDDVYMGLGNNMQVGLGADIDEIRQIRNKFLDTTFREENGRLSYYSQNYSVVSEIEQVFSTGDDGGFDKTLSKFWKSLNELSKHPDGLETRALFIQNSALLVTEAKNISEQLSDYQLTLNAKIKNVVNDVNGISKQIYDLNEKINLAEVGGDKANDYRDQRNLLMDKLSGLVQITYKEESTGKISIWAEGIPLVTPERTNNMVLEPILPGSPMLKPVWENSGRDVINIDQNIDSKQKNDSGVLKSILFLRGTMEANYTTSYKDVEKYTIPKLQKQFDNLIHDIVTMVNDYISPKNHNNGPKGLDDSQYIEIFSRERVNRYDDTGKYIEESLDNAETLYTAKNIVINPAVLANYNKICISEHDEKGDNSLVEKIISAWDDKRIKLEEDGLDLDYNQYYNQFIREIGNMGNEAKSYINNQEILVKQIDNQRNQNMGVSMDEEMGNMLKFQHSYNASAKVISTLNSMLDTLINRMGA